MYKANDYTEEIIKNATWRKCFSPQNNARLLDFLIDRQWIPSQVSIDRALTELKFLRTDGGSASTDAQAAVNAAQHNLDQVIAETAASPLTRAELEHFQSLSFPDLQRQYWGEDLDSINSFAVRYNRAAKEQGFRIPARPRVEEVIDDSKELKLSASDYHNLPAQVVGRRLQAEPAFKRAVYRLIKAGAIALVFGLLQGGL
jgi:hypothetical protein